MWKKQWNKLKTALGEPEDYVSEEGQEDDLIDEEQPEPEQPVLCSDPLIEIKSEDILPLVATVEQLRTFKGQCGEMMLRHEQERAKAVQINSRLNAQLDEQIANLRSIYNVEPTVEYALNFPNEKGGMGTLTRESDKD
jgi:hypothetical protein